MTLVRFATAAMLAAVIVPVQDTSAAGRAKAKYDPNQLICESRQEIGSRLKRIRVCHTAQEWEEVRTQEKVGLMRKQYNGSSGAAGAITRDAPW